MSRCMKYALIFIFALTLVSGGIAQQYNMSGLEFSPDRQMIAVADVLGEFRLYDAQSHMLIKTLATDGGGINEIRWSPDGTRIAGASSEGLVSVWKVDSGERLYSVYIQLPDNQNSVIKAIWSISWSIDGQRLALSADEGVVIVDASRGTRLQVLETGAVYDSAWAPGPYLLTTGQFSGLNIWTSELSNVYDGKLPALVVAYNADGTRFAALVWTAQSNPTSGELEFVETYQIWDVATLSITASFEFVATTMQTAGRMKWSPDGTHLAVSHADDIVRVWNVSTLLLVDEIPIGDALWAFDWLNNSQIIYAADEETLNIVSVEVTRPRQSPLFPLSSAWRGGWR